MSANPKMKFQWELIMFCKSGDRSRSKHIIKQAWIIKRCSEDRSRKMGVLHSITRFLCCKTEQGKEEEESERPLLHQHYPPNGDSSKTLPKIIASLIYKALKALLQKVRFIVLYLRRPRKDDPILPVQNPAPTIITNDHPSLPLPISSSSTTSETPPATVNNVYVVSSHEWPTCHISATRKEIADHHLVASDEIIGLTVLLEEIGQGGNVPVVEEEESSREISPSPPLWLLPLALPPTSLLLLSIL